LGLFDRHEAEVKGPDHQNQHNEERTAKRFIIFLGLTFIVSIFLVASPSSDNLHRKLAKRQINLPDLPDIPDLPDDDDPPAPPAPPATPTTPPVVPSSRLPVSSVNVPATAVVRTRPAQTVIVGATSTPPSSDPASNDNSQQAEATKKQNTILIPCVVVGTCVLLAVLGIHAFRKWKLRPSNNFKRRLESEKFNGSSVTPSQGGGESMKRPGVVTYGNLPPPPTVAYTSSTTQPQYYTTQAPSAAYYPPNQEQQQGYYQQQDGYYQNHQQY
jgi:hypothetical protein